jgi:hypothetical protein
MSVDTLFVPKQGALSDLADWIAGDLGSCYVRLYVNNVVYTPDRVCGDYTEASFAGYSPASGFSWGAPFTNLAGKAETDSPALTFTFTGATGTHTAFGIFITDAAQSKLLAVIPFLAPVIFSPGSPTETRMVQVTEVSEA